MLQFSFPKKIYYHDSPSKQSRQDYQFIPVIVTVVFLLDVTHLRAWSTTWPHAVKQQAAGRTLALTLCFVL